MADATPLIVDVISDAVCPWCFIGMKRLETAIAMVPEVEVATRWRPYQLDSTIPAGGLPRQEYMLAKFGSEQRLKEAHETVTALGEAEGIRFHFDAIAVAPNTLDAHRLIRWAGSGKAPAGTQPRMVRRLFEMFFEEGRDIGDRAILREAAADCEMDAGLVEALLASPADADAVKAEIAMAGQMGIRGVPCFLIEGKYAVMGAQDAEKLADAIRQIAAAKARGELEQGE